MATAKKQAEESAQQPEDGPKVMAEPEGGWPPDEFTGKAGSYVRDPYTGIRRPADADPAAEPTQEGA